MHAEHTTTLTTAAATTAITLGGIVLLIDWHVDSHVDMPISRLTRLGRQMVGLHTTP